jgi:hypothetical protein
MAMDAAMPGQERGADPVRSGNGNGQSDYYDEDWQDLFTLLRDRLSPEDCAKAEELIVRMIGDPLGQDEPPAFQGKPPRPGMDPSDQGPHWGYSRPGPSHSPGNFDRRLAGDKKVAPRPRNSLERRFGPDVARLRYSEPGPSMALDGKAKSRPRPDGLARRFGADVGRLKVAY